MMKREYSRQETVDSREKDLLFYTGNLIGEECLCGRVKMSKNSVCLRCWRALPQEMQRALYRRMGHGYEEAFEAAVKWLQENVWE